VVELEQIVVPELAHDGFTPIERRPEVSTARITARMTGLSL
jgi:hypothetical protein